MAMTELLIEKTLFLLSPTISKKDNSFYQTKSVIEIKVYMDIVQKKTSATLYSKSLI